MFVVDYPTFKRIVNKPKSGLEDKLEGQIYYYENPEEFILFYNDGFWQFKSIVSKVELMSFDEEGLDSIKKFKDEELRHAINILNYEKQINVVIR